MKVKVFAKLNLTLAVGARNGRFHPVDSLVTSVDVYDTVEVLARADGQVLVHCDYDIEVTDNSAYRAAVAFKEAFDTRGVEISVRKGIPVGAGMGGSSADAAATVYCMCKLFGVDVHSAEVHALCAQSGSDINFMLRGGFARMQGKGDELTFWDRDVPMCFALTVFDTRLSTADVYAAYDNLSAVEPSELGASEGYRFTKCFNQLERAACSLDNYADNYRAYVREHGWTCCMTGSGSAYFIPFESQADADVAVRALNEKGFHTKLCTPVKRGIEEL